MAGSEQLAALAVRLKGADKLLRVELLRQLKTAAAPLVSDVKTAARDKLPKRGGLNEQVAGQKVTVQVRTGAKTAGVRLTTKAPDTAQTDAGYVRHPEFGREKWVIQQIPNAAGWWSQTLANAAPEVTPVLLSAMERVSQKIQGRH